MLNYFKIYEDENRAIYRFILDKDPEREGFVEFDKKCEEMYEATKLLKAAKDDTSFGWVKLARNLFKMNPQGFLKDYGLIAWY